GHMRPQGGRSQIREATSRCFNRTVKWRGKEPLKPAADRTVSVIPAEPTDRRKAPPDDKLREGRNPCIDYWEVLGLRIPGSPLRGAPERHLGESVGAC